MHQQSVSPERQRRLALPPATRQGVRDAAPVVLGYIPFALALGAAFASARIGAFTAWSSSWLIFGGAAQLVAVQMLGVGGAAVVIIGTALVVNSRHILYGASMAPHTREWSLRQRLLGGYFLADPVFALVISRFDAADRGDTSRTRWQYMVGVSLTLWSGWQVLTVSGTLLGAVLPSGLPLGLVTALTFLLLLLPTIKGADTIAAAAAGGVVALVTVGLPLGLNLVAGAVAGIATGMAVGAGNDRSAA
jgi:predicted branched-subunit amino acid permease